MKIFDIFEDEVDIKYALRENLISDCGDQIWDLQHSVSQLIKLCVILSDILIKNNLMTKQQLETILDANYHIGE